MESFLVSFTPLSSVTIFTALCKRVEAGEWTDNKEEELENFLKTLDSAIQSVKDRSRLEQLYKFRKGDLLKQCDICKKFVQEKQEKYNRPSRVYGDAIFGKFLDEPEKLRELTNQILIVLNQVWSSPKWKASSSASAERKGSYQRARCPDYMVVAQVSNIEVEIGYLETGCPKSSLDKQIRDHKKLNRLGKDSIDVTKLSKHKRKFEKLAMRYMSIFTINVAGDV
ncbi:6394_t:CDS:2, partial [Racocetra fulgida]